MPAHAASVASDPVDRSDTWAHLEPHARAMVFALLEGGATSAQISMSLRWLQRALDEDALLDRPATALRVLLDATRVFGIPCAIHGDPDGPTAAFDAYLARCGGKPVTPASSGPRTPLAAPAWVLALASPRGFGR